MSQRKQLLVPEASRDVYVCPQCGYEMSAVEVISRLEDLQLLFCPTCTKGDK